MFKAAITACVGLCFAQHLWYILRGAATPISLIEKLFILQNNLFAIGDIRVVRRAPLLFAMALFGWCLGIATIYPPGALIITLEPYTFIEDRNISVMNPPVPLDFNPFMEDEYLQYPRLSGRRGSPECSTDVSPGQPPFCMVEYYYWYVLSLSLWSMSSW